MRSLPPAPRTLPWRGDGVVSGPAVDRAGGGGVDRVGAVSPEDVEAAPSGHGHVDAVASGASVDDARAKGRRQGRDHIVAACRHRDGAAALGPGSDHVVAGLAPRLRIDVGARADPVVARSAERHRMVAAARADVVVAALAPDVGVAEERGGDPMVVAVAHVGEHRHGRAAQRRLGEAEVADLLERGACRPGWSCWSSTRPRSVPRTGSSRGG